MKYLIVILLFLLVSPIARSQEFGVAADVGYSYKFINKPLSQLYVGAIAAYSKGNRGYNAYEKQFLFGGGAYYGKYNGKQAWIPALTLGYGSFMYLTKLSITPYSATPSINLNVFNFAQLGVGYSVGYRRKNDFNFNGLVLSINLAIGMPSYYISPSN